MTHDLVVRLRKTGHTDYALMDEAADKLEGYMAENAALRAERDEIRRATVDTAAAICERQAKFFRDLSSDSSCLSDVRWNSREEARHTMQSYAERHETDAAAIRNMGERDNAPDCDKLSVQQGEDNDAEFQPAKRATEEPAASGDRSIEGAGQTSIPSRHPGSLLGKRPRANDQSGNPNLRNSVGHPAGRAALEKETRE